MDFATHIPMMQIMTVTPPQFRPVLVEGPVELRPLGDKDFAAWADLRERSRAHLTRWEDNWSEAGLSERLYRQRRLGFEREARRGRAIAWHIFADHGKLVGGATLTNIRYGAARTATLGYWIGVDSTRRGYASAAVRAVSAHAFGAIRLNRIEAACQIDNVASIGVLERCGFSLEGVGRDYLTINGVLQDHKLFSLVTADHGIASNQRVMGDLGGRDCRAAQNGSELLPSHAPGSSPVSSFSE